MSRAPLKKYVLVSIEDGDTKQTFRKLRRYLSSHKIKYVSASNATDLMQHFDNLQNNSLVCQENMESDEELDNISVGGKAIITTNASSSHQEALEQWARAAFPEGSEEMQLLLSALPGDQEEHVEEIINHTSNDNNVQETQIWNTDIPQLFTLNSIEFDEGLENGKDEGQDTIDCQICECQVEVGRNRNTKIRRQAQHVIEKHSLNGFCDVEISKRYQCLQCFRTLPVSKSPCEHISEYHEGNEIDTDFKDLWNKDQLLSFNIVMDKCFNRHLPVPRSRRFRNQNGEMAHIKSSYRIISQEDEVVQIKTVVEKPHADSAGFDGLTAENVNKTSTSAILDNSNAHNDETGNDLYLNDQEFRGIEADVLEEHCYSSKPLQNPNARHQL